MTSMKPYSQVEDGDMIIREGDPYRVTLIRSHPDGEDYVVDMHHMHTKVASMIRVKGTVRVKVVE